MDAYVNLDCISVKQDIYIYIRGIIYVFFNCIYLVFAGFIKIIN